MKWLLIGFVKAWRALFSPMYGQVCKYYPSCSEYALDALRLHGAIRGGRLATWRLLRCNPWSHGGFDPVPGSELEAKAAVWWGPSDETPRGDAPGPGGPTISPDKAGLTTAYAVMG